LLPAFFPKRAAREKKKTPPKYKDVKVKLGPVIAGGAIGVGLAEAGKELWRNKDSAEKKRYRIVPRKTPFWKNKDFLVGTVSGASAPLAALLALHLSSKGNKSGLPQHDVNTEAARSGARGADELKHLSPDDASKTLTDRYLDLQAP
jgi:hypothetical protein